MQPAAIKLLVLRAVALLIALSPAAAALGASRDDANLFAHGTDDRFWAARVAPKVDAKPPRDVTTVIGRGAGEAERWKTLAEIPARAIAVTRRGGELVVLLDGGDWKFVSEAGVRSGDRLPGGAPVLAIAGDDETLWAVGHSSPAPATTRAAALGTTIPSTGPEAERPSAAMAPATTSPTTATNALPFGLAGVHTLFRMDRGQWTAVAPLPEALARAKAGELSMTVLANQPIVAGFALDDRIHVYELTSSNEWTTWATVPTSDTRRFELFAIDGRPALWLTGAQGAGWLRRLDDTSDLIELKAADRIDRGRVVAPALGRLRLLYVDGDERLHEQPFGADGKPVGDPAAATIERPPGSRRVTDYVQFAVMALLLFVMSGTIRRRQALQEAIRRAHRLPLAPYGRRLLAGTIDAVPLLSWAAVLLVLWIRGTAITTETGELLELWLWGAAALYLLHTTAVEVFFGRSLGKMLLGLRPATLEGAKPSRRALLARNLLRVIDIVLVFPLVMILFSPLRQRVGDLAAGTLVLRDGEPIPLMDDADDDQEPEPPRGEN